MNDFSKIFFCHFIYVIKLFHGLLFMDLLYTYLIWVNMKLLLSLNDLIVRITIFIVIFSYFYLWLDVMALFWSRYDFDFVNWNEFRQIEFLHKFIYTRNSPKTSSLFENFFIYWIKKYILIEKWPHIFFF